MNKQKLIASLESQGVVVRDGKIKRSDLEKVLTVALTCNSNKELDDDEFECEKCHQVFDVEDSIKDSKKGEMLCLDCAGKSKF